MSKIEITLYGLTIKEQISINRYSSISDVKRLIVRKYCSDLAPNEIEIKCGGNILDDDTNINIVERRYSNGTALSFALRKIEKIDIKFKTRYVYCIYYIL